MKLIEPKVEMLVQEPGIDGMYKIIDKIAGICYGRTELHEDSKVFVDKLILKLRCDKAANPDAIYLAEQVRELLKQ